MSGISAVCAVVLALLTTNPVNAAEVSVVSSPPTAGKNSYYLSNRSPLMPRPLVKLPVGSVKPGGWLRHQLELEADGFTGHLPEVAAWGKYEGNAWASPNGQGHSPWEELPYWLKGYISLGYVLGDQKIIADSQKWAKGILSTARPNGYFGTQHNLDSMDLWPNMIALYVLRTHYEATGDQRVIDTMLNYCRWLQKVPLEQFLNMFWENSRGGDNLDVILWLYNQTGEKCLLDLARVNHEQTANWSATIPNWHGVNMAQCFREPGQFYQQCGDSRYLKAAERNYQTVRGIYGEVPGGLYGADENCRQGYTGPRQAAETCAMVEMMWSCEMLAGISGDITWLDRCEDVAFNSFPASMTPDLRGLHYLTAPNQVQLCRANKAPMIQNGGDMFSYDPRSYRCCQHNVAFGWPYYAEHLWMATLDNGLAAVLYSEGEVTAKVAGGVEVKLIEETSYPFGDGISITIATPKAVKFPLYLRVPEWCQSARVAVNGKDMAAANTSGKWIVLNREWKNGDKINLQLPMQINIKTWEKNRGSLTVYRGPLSYSVKIGEEWKRYGGTDDFPAFEVFPTTDWNYGLVVDKKNPTGSIQVVKQDTEIKGQPWTPDNAPIILKAKARKIPGWQKEANGMVMEVQKSPIKSDQPVEEITLIPMGCARLRISCFPEIGDGPDANAWDTSGVSISASYAFDVPEALKDGVEPARSSDLAVPRFTWWDHTGSKEWVQYEFSQPKKLSSSEVYWFNDEPTMGQCRQPASWRLLYRAGNEWKPVENASSYGVELNKYNRVEFKPVETTAIRIEAQLRQGFSAGILEWKVSDK